MSVKKGLEDDLETIRDFLIICAACLVKREVLFSDAAFTDAQESLLRIHGSVMNSPKIGGNGNGGRK